MRAKVDRATTLQTQFDSSALTPLCTVIHRLQEPGLYQGEVLSDLALAAGSSLPVPNS